MSDADMINAIIQALQTDENVIILLRAMITGTLNAGGIPDQSLQNMCAALGISTS